MVFYFKAFIGLLIHLASPLVLIWSLNTLFNTGIPFSFKTWAAGILLIFLARHHLNPRTTSRPACVDYYDDDYEEDEECEEDRKTTTKEDLSKRLAESIEKQMAGQQPEPKGRKNRRKQQPTGE